MGEITIEQIVSVDGYAVDAAGGIGFFDAVDFGDQARTDTEQMRWLGSVDAILFGRRTYEMFAAYWPQTDPGEDAASGPIGRLPKYVVSRSLERAPWGAAEIEVLRDGPEAAARLLTSRHRSIAIWGSLELTDALFRASLVDRLRLRRVPLLLGSGRAVAPAETGQIPLELVSSQRDGSGVVTDEYRLGAAPRPVGATT
jgi:dihydrofolate reductase